MTEHVCVCGHAKAAHQHFRSGSDCGSCGAERCPRFRQDRHAGRQGDLRETPVPQSEPEQR